MVKLNKRLRTILVVVILIITFLLVYSPHFSYPYPLHIDEWHHIGNAEKILDGNYDYSQNNFEVGYDIIISGIFAFFRILKINIVLAYSFLPAIFAVITSLILFFFIRKIAGFTMAIFSMLFFASLPSNVNILGLWFATPLTLAIPLIFLFFYLFTVGFTRKKMLYYSIIVLFALFFIHPSTGLIIYPIMIIYTLIFRHSMIIKNWKPLIILLLLPILPLILFLFYISIPTMFETILFRKGYTPVEPNLLLPFIYGIIPFLLAVLGMVFAFLNRRMIMSKKMEIFIIFLLITAVLLILFNIFKVSFLAPYQRVLYLGMLSLIPLTALGLERSLFHIKKIIKDKRAYIILSTIFVLIILFLTFYNYGQAEDRFKPYHLIDDEDYSSLIKLREISTNNLIFSPIIIGDAIYPISKNKPIASLFILAGLQVYEENKANNLRNDVSAFYLTKDCTRKEELLAEYKAEYVLSPEEIDCDFLILKDSSKKYFIYQLLNID